MVCAVGLNAAAACAAIRARVGRVEETLFVDRLGEPILGAHVPEAVSDQVGYRRMIPLLGRAVRECVTKVLGEKPGSGSLPPLLVAVGAPDRPDYPPDLATRLLPELEEESGLTFGKGSEVVGEDTLGFFRALDKAGRLFSQGRAEACVVAGVDSLISDRALGWLQDKERLKTKVNADGVIPGEAAAALWLVRTGQREGTIAVVTGVGFGEEPSAKRAGEPNVALGLAQAIKEALRDAGIGLHDVAFRVGGMTGERHVFMEASTAIARVQRVHREDFELWVPAEKLGDVGAALPACMAVLTAVGIAEGHAVGPRAILYTSSILPGRAACVIEEAGIGRG
jgi:3-oxoacyl-[acyl-carrier-protein] synthase-1